MPFVRLLNNMPSDTSPDNSKYSCPLNNTGLGIRTLTKSKIHLLYTVSSPYLWFPCICHATLLDSTNCRLSSTVTFTIEKNLTVEMKVRESPLDLEKLDRNTENQELYYSLTKTKQNHQTTLSTYLQQTFSKLMKIQTLHWITSLCCSVDKSCLTLGNPRYFSTPGFPVHHYLHITLEYWL